MIYQPRLDENSHNDVIKAMYQWAVEGYEVEPGGLGEFMRWTTEQMYQYHRES